MLNFKFKDFCTIYRAGSGLYKGACFSNGNTFVDYNNHNHTVYYIQKTYNNSKSYCFLTFRELVVYLKEISESLGFKVLSINSNDKYYLVQTENINDRRFFLFISTLIRYAYEFPFSLLLKCVINNKELLQKVSIIQLMQFYLSLFYVNNIHALHAKSYTNINMSLKNLYTALKQNFNSYNVFCIVTETVGDGSLRIFSNISEKNVPEIIDGLNFLISKIWKKYEKDICCR